ncbi:S41 family peptidase [Azospirillum sp. SYSU D00513]|uniref:S41 family peptidase n=1 Tax=Azospirillum sp. SYSU D00513 TaxID=2812561 RepID=UPI0020002D85|nr:S41 family peptidase [Azospirillum sp. SYSU D00513]
MLTLAAQGLLPGRASADPAFVSEQVFAVGYGRIAEAYLQPVDLGRLGPDGLKGLASIDPTLRIERSDSLVRVQLSDAPAEEFAAPAPSDAAGWASLTARILDSVRSRSPLLSQAAPERIYQAVFDAVAADLDGYSRYTGTRRASTERAQREGYGGIGLALERKDGRTWVSDVLPRSPAERAGIRAGDTLLAIDGDMAASLTEDDMRDRLRGPTGTMVMITVRGSAGEPRRLPVRRERVVPNTVSTTIVERTGVLKVERFNASTAANLREAIQTAKGTIGASVRGFVLDLRGNPGGLLDQAVAVADLFMTRGRIITTEGRHPDSRQRFDASPDDVTNGLPLVVLVDGRSASAAEVVAAALQDSGRAVVVGASSYGKGSVQTVTRLPNDGELFLTWSRIYTPAGYTLHRQGVQPMVCTSRNGQDDPVALLSELRDGNGRSAAQFAGWRAKAADDEEALNHLRSACPWKEHAPELDLKVALRLVEEPALYQRAVALASTHTVAER